MLNYILRRMLDEEEVKYTIQNSWYVLACSNNFKLSKQQYHEDREDL